MPLSAYAWPEFQSDKQAENYEFYSARYLAPLIDEPRARLVAQCYQESRLNPTALNRTSGAAGECQFMAATWGDYLRAHGLTNVSRFNSRHNIKAAAWYDRRLWAFWSTERPDNERWSLVLASYNAGAGNILKAQQEAGGALYWADINSYLYKITGRHSVETIGYVESIDKWFNRIIEDSEP